MACRNKISAEGRLHPLLPHISSAHAIHWSRVCHVIFNISSAHAIHWLRVCQVIFKRAHRFENSTKHTADDLCVNLVCEYFCWILGDPHFFSGRSLSFLTLFIILKNKKNLCMGSFNYLSYTIRKRVELVHGYRCA